MNKKITFLSLAALLAFSGNSFAVDSSTTSNVAGTSAGDSSNSSSSSFGSSSSANNSLGGGPASKTNSSINTRHSSMSLDTRGDNTLGGHTLDTNDSKIASHRNTDGAAGVRTSGNVDRFSNRTFSTNAQLNTQFQTAFKNNPALSNIEGFEAIDQGNDILLRGKVRTAREKQDAEDSIRRSLNGKNIRSEITVSEI